MHADHRWSCVPGDDPPGPGHIVTKRQEQRGHKMVVHLCPTLRSEMGLSSRLRGSLPAMTASTRPARPIPAPAGKPISQRVWVRLRRAYPRACGEARDDQLGPREHQGLSPRLRGSLGGVRPQYPHARPIPAPAGKPLRGALSLDTAEAYPRACGEAVRSAAALWRTRGLSPRLRGSRCRCCAASLELGPIPAPAGKPLPGGITRASG